ncbi:MAG: monovalent cation/H(+) antiporter subunit G [Anaerolineaceae bacterium]|nr:monovalent cation/H(+) antiporter subunit G [Anaerolineaceae bacterium]
MTLVEGLTALLLLTGAFFMLMGAVGIVRLPDLFMRMSATTKSATLGVSFMMLAVALHFNDLAIGARALATILFVFLTAPIAAHMIARAGYLRGVSLWRGTISDELRGRYNEETGELSSGAPAMAPPQGEPED